jgi:hypothetical protein
MSHQKASAVPDNVKEPSSSVDVSVRQQGTHGIFFINLFACEGIEEESPVFQYNLLC